MKNLKMLGLAAVAAMALTAFAAAGTASATTIEVEGNAQNKAVAFTVTLEGGKASFWKNTMGEGLNSCTQSEWNGGTLAPYTEEEEVNANFAAYFFGECLNPVTIHKPGIIEIEWTQNTEAKVYSTGTEVTVKTGLGTLTCTTKERLIGVLKGVNKGNAELSVNAVIECGITVKWTATYLFTSPNGFGVVE